MGITLFNHPSVYFNAVIYLKNWYDNPSAAIPRFPFYPDVHMERLDFEAGWNYGLELYAEPPATGVNANSFAIGADAAWEVHCPGLIARLTEDEGRQALVSKALESFYVWWRMTPCGGRYSLEFFSDSYVEKLHNEIQSLLGGSMPDPSDLGLLLTYDRIPEGFQCFHSHYAVLSIKELPGTGGVSQAAAKIFGYLQNR